MPPTAAILGETPADSTLRIDSRLQLRHDEKEKLGEVLTPTSLVDEVCGCLPEWVWSDPSLRWLDPAAGTGNFMSIVYHRLDTGLCRWQPDATKRRAHILSSMLFQVEINPEHTAALRRLFGSTANIICADFLQEGWVDRFGGATYDVVIGNPPFSYMPVRMKGTHVRRALWGKFIVAGLEALVPGGLLAMIVPNGWRGTGEHRAVGQTLRSKELLCLRMHGLDAGRERFGVATRFDIFVARNASATAATETQVTDTDGHRHTLRFATWPFIPSARFAAFAALLHAGPHTGSRAPIYTTEHHSQQARNPCASPEKSERFSHPVVHSINAKGIGLWYSTKTGQGVGGIGIPKVMLNLNSRQYSHPEQNDFRGRFGMTQLTFGIPISSEAEGDMVLSAVATPLFQALVAASKWKAFQTDYRMFRHFRDDWPEWVLEESKKEGRDGAEPSSGSR